MAITSAAPTAGSRTHLAITIVVAADGAGVGAQTATMTNGSIVAELIPGSSLDLLWTRTYASQADARNRLLRHVTSAGAYFRGLVFSIASRGGNPLGIDVGVDGALLPTLILTQPAPVAEDFFIRMIRPHTQVA